MSVCHINELNCLIATCHHVTLCMEYNIGHSSSAEAIISLWHFVRIDPDDGHIHEINDVAVPSKQRCYLPTTPTNQKSMQHRGITTRFHSTYNRPHLLPTIVLFDYS